MKDSLVSIIVAVYKIEKELPRCLDSIVKQTYDNIEILVVDDGSPDNCPAICDFYKSKDSRITVFHKENGGLSSARNYALNRAKGNYISFIDGDDWVEADFIETLVTGILSENADISIVGYTMIWDNNKTRLYSSKLKHEIYNREQAIHELLIQQKFQCMVWNKLYKRSAFCNVKFPDGKLYEDVPVSLDIFKQCTKVILIGESKYFYYQRDNSIVNSKFNYEKMSLLNYSEEIINYSISIGGIYNLEAESFFLRSILMLMLQAYDNMEDPEVREAIKQLNTKIRKHKKYILTNPYIDIRKKILLLAILIHFSPSLLNKLYKIKAGR